MGYLLVRAIRAGKRRFLNKLCTCFYRLSCSKFGAGSHVAWGCWIASPEKVVIGENVYIGPDCEFGTELSEGYLVIDDGVQINRGVTIDYTGGVSIGSGTLISEDTKIYSHTHGKDPRSAPLGIKKTIGSNVWLGARVIILDQCVLLASGSRVGAGAVVSKPVRQASTVVAAKLRAI